jgi:hypothetical protein
MTTFTLIVINAALAVGLIGLLISVMTRIARTASPLPVERAPVPIARVRAQHSSARAGHGAGAIGARV